MYNVVKNLVSEYHILMLYQGSPACVLLKNLFQKFKKKKNLFLFTNLFLLQLHWFVTFYVFYDIILLLL